MQYTQPGDQSAWSTCCCCALPVCITYRPAWIMIQFQLDLTLCAEGHCLSTVRTFLYHTFRSNHFNPSVKRSLLGLITRDFRPTEKICRTLGFRVILSTISLVKRPTVRTFYSESTGFYEWRMICCCTFGRFVFVQETENIAKTLLQVLFSARFATSHNSQLCTQTNGSRMSVFTRLLCKYKSLKMAVMHFRVCTYCTSKKSL